MPWGAVHLSGYPGDERECPLCERVVRGLRCPDATVRRVGGRDGGEACFDS